MSPFPNGLLNTKLTDAYIKGVVLRRVMSILSMVMIGVLGISAPSAAAVAAEPALIEQESAPAAYSDEIESPFPDVMTNEQMEEVLSRKKELVFTDAGEPSARSAAVGDSCHLVPGIMWKRTSGNIYTYGAVGSKPKLSNCTAGVASTQLSSEVWMHNGWIWFRAAGPFVSYGTGNMQQTMVEYVCKGTGVYPFQVISVGTGTNSAGQSAVGTDSTGEYQFACG